jgi:hypothetical protein
LLLLLQYTSDPLRADSLTLMTVVSVRYYFTNLAPTMLKKASWLGSIRRWSVTPEFCIAVCMNMLWACF